MNINEIKELFTQFDHSSLTEFDLKDGSFELYMNKNQQSRGTETTAVPAKQKENSSNESTTQRTVEEQPTATTESTSEKPGAGEPILSPIVGVVYLQPSPDKPAFVKVGDRVKKGEVLCIIEAMKLMNEIVSEKDGTITEIMVTNEDVVEFGQPLFCVQPD